MFFFKIFSKQGQGWLGMQSSNFLLFFFTPLDASSPYIVSSTIVRGFGKEVLVAGDGH